MSTEPQCPQCSSQNTYSDGILWICPHCSHEWSMEQNKTSMADAVSEFAVKDAYGNPLKDGDAVTVIKDLKVKGASAAVKAGTKVKNIRLIEAEDGHNISCRIEEFGSMNLKSEFVKKA